MLLCVQKLLDFLEGKVELALDAGGAPPMPMPTQPLQDADASEPAAKRAKLAGEGEGGVAEGWAVQHLDARPALARLSGCCQAGQTSRQGRGVTLEGDGAQI